MAPLPVIAGTSRVAFNWGPLIATNVMHFHQDTVDPAGLFSSLDAHMQAGMWNAVCDSQRVQEVVITPLDGSSGSASFLPATTPKWRGQTSGECSPQVACVVSLHTALRGRSARGRAFVGPVAEAATANGFLTPAQLAIIAPAWATFGSAMVVASSEQVVASYKLSSALTVINWSVRNACGTMRLRQSRLAA